MEWVRVKRVQVKRKGEGGTPRLGVESDDKMETFFLVRFMLNFIWVRRDTSTLLGLVQSETLKYLYALFSDNSVSPFDRRIYCRSSTHSSG